ncbi:MAG TPA: glycosyltransferase [Pyrinomonadaceae bacterium]|nr:glycosyltransferase [Pyrinomonadaceae bacterium]
MVEKYPTSFDLHQQLPPDSSKPRVSILVTTYNQEHLITQAIDSILMQDVNFAYEIVIGEDASTDRTREIVIALGQQHPDKIRVLLRNEEVANRDRAIGLAGKINYLEALRACRGEYVAILDGDDYFTSPHKLQKQVDFLESHPDCAICFHNVIAIHENGAPAEEMCAADQTEISDIEELLWGNFIPACSIMYRREPLVQIPGWFLTARMGDWPLNIFKAQYGKIGYINEVMAAYRVHAAGVWSPRKRSQQLLTSIRVLENIDRDLGYKYRHTIRRAKTRFFFELAELYLERGHARFALVPVRRGLWESRGRHKGIVSLWLRLKGPRLYQGFRSLKRVAGVS